MAEHRLLTITVGVPNVDRGGRPDNLARGIVDCYDDDLELVEAGWVDEAGDDPTEPVVLIVDEAKASLIGARRGVSGSVRIVARSYDADDSQTGIELSYWAYPENGGIPRVNDKLRLTIELEDE